MNSKNTLITTLTHNNKKLIIKVIKSKLTNKINIKISYKIYGAKVIIPNSTPFTKGISFAEKNLLWIINSLKSFQPENLLNLKFINILGEKLLVKVINSNNKPQVYIENSNLIILGNINNKELLINTFKQFIKKIFKEYASLKLKKQTHKLKINFNKLFIKDSESRWGSCSNLRNISLNYRLIFAPKNIIDYIINHEIAHLLYFNHSTNFWKLVAQLSPDYKEAKLWLKNEGKNLYLIRL